MPYKRLIARVHLDGGGYGVGPEPNCAWTDESWRMWFTMLRGDLRRLERDYLDPEGSLQAQIVRLSGVDHADVTKVLQAFFEIP